MSAKSGRGLKYTLPTRSLPCGLVPMEATIGSYLVAPIGMKPQLYPHLLILLPSPCTRGEVLGVRGFALCFDCFLIVNSMSSCVLEA